MVSTEFVTTNAWKSEKQLTRTLGLKGKNDFTELIVDSLFAPIFMKLYEAVIVPEQDEASSRPSKERSRGPDLDHIPKRKTDHFAGFTI